MSRTGRERRVDARISASLDFEGAIRDYEIREGLVVGREHRVDGVFLAYGGTTRDHETMKRGLLLVADNVRDLLNATWHA